ncbi:hypothetical protein [Staphylococcus auricularis]|uniref:Uncharacterized protein n=1 Tax=Staphylococcus auricularis TaxID=29379 RepID=A0ABX5IE86_9STAP|nr:hypothetical protein [Staphylococcus auricularis]MCE5038473.1 hypothetical protein [Staphylococcus auricularis]MEB6570285.1 hypothetical protein [Staphylococcus auricularis]PTH15702.1 hypothetical protein BU607_08585 [Staphylococcus auricularis]
MIEGTYAVYRGLTCKVIAHTGNEVEVVTDVSSDIAEHLGFEPSEVQHEPQVMYHKWIPLDDIDELYELKQEARYRGTVFDLFYDNETPMIGTEEADKATAFGLAEVHSNYYSKAVKEDEIENIIFHQDLK